MRRNRQFLCIFGIVIVMEIITYGTKKYKQWQEEYSGIPDITSCVSVNNDHYLTVIANIGKIEDKEEFARRVICMCQKNSFRSIRFSTDINGYPLSVSCNSVRKSKSAFDNRIMLSIGMCFDWRCRIRAIPKSGVGVSSMISFAAKRALVTNSFKETP